MRAARCVTELRLSKRERLAHLHLDGAEMDQRLLHYRSKVCEPETANRSPPWKKRMAASGRSDTVAVANLGRDHLKIGDS
jgi:hypothetical protein